MQQIERLVGVGAKHRLEYATGDPARHGRGVEEASRALVKTIPKGPSQTIQDPRESVVHRQVVGGELRFEGEAKGEGMAPREASDGRRGRFVVDSGLGDERIDIGLVEQAEWETSSPLSRSRSAAHSNMGASRLARMTRTEGPSAGSSSWRSHGSAMRNSS